MVPRGQSLPSPEHGARCRDSNYPDTETLRCRIACIDYVGMESQRARNIPYHGHKRIVQKGLPNRFPVSRDAVIQEEKNRGQSIIYCNRELQDTGRVMYPDWIRTGTSRSHVQAPCEAVWKKISGQTDGTGRPSRRFEGAKTLHLQVFCSALGRTRICDRLIRSQTVSKSDKLRC